MKNIISLAVLFILFQISNLAQKNQIIKDSNSTFQGDGTIFEKIFLYDVNKKSNIPCLDKLKYESGLYTLNSNQTKQINSINSKILSELKEKYPKFLDSFNVQIKSGNPFFVQKALARGSNIILGIMLKDSLSYMKDIVLSPKIRLEDKAMLKKLNESTDCNEIVKIVETGIKNGFFSRTFMYKNGFGWGMEEKNPWPKPEPDKALTIGVIFNENVFINIDAIINLNVAININAAFNVPFQGYSEKNLLREKIIAEITRVYKSQVLNGKKTQ